MRQRFVIVLAIFIFAVAAVSLGLAQGRGGRGGAQPLDITGNWSGTWSTYSPTQGATPPKEVCAKLDAQVALVNGVWEATFEGDCGRPYKYSIKMQGRQSGNAVLFSGSADLGAADGGVYDWIGRATNNEFVGFYTNAFTTGVFALKRAN